MKYIMKTTRAFKSSALYSALLLTSLCTTATGQSNDLTVNVLLNAAAPARDMTKNAQPNILFIIADDLNLALGSYAESKTRPHYSTVNTPNLDKLAAQGIRFENAFVQNPLCSPSRASLLSGLRPATHGVHTTRQPPLETMSGEMRLLPEHFHDNGYYTARVGKVGHNTYEDIVDWDSSNFALSRDPEAIIHFPGYLPGIDRSEVRDITWGIGSENGMNRQEVLRSVGGRPLGLPLSWRATDELTRMTPDGTTSQRIIQLLAQNRDKPFFIAAGFHKPHQPWVAPAKFFDQHPLDQIQLPPQREGVTIDIPGPATEISKFDAQLTERQHKQAIAAYHATVTMMDTYVGELMQALEDLDLADSTIVVFTSDHGFQLNEHGGLWRKNVQFDESIRVPLIVRLPDGGNAGAAVPGLVELVDLYPTLAELVNLPKPAHDLEGLSFVPLLENPTRQWKSAAFSQSRREGHDGLTIRTDRYRYTQWSPLEGAGATMKELYDLQQDPMEFNNLADEPAHASRVAELSKRLAQGWQGALPKSLIN